METNKQWKRVSFDIELAKKIQAGEIEGKIVRKGAPKQVCEILEFYAEWQTHCDEKFLIVKVPAHDFEREQLWIYHQDGRAHHNDYPEMWYDLVLEIPNENHFKPYDKVLVRNPYTTGSCASIDTWIPGIFQYKNSNLYFVSGQLYWECIPYEGNEHLVGTTDKPIEY